MADIDSCRVRFADVITVADDERNSPQIDKNDNAMKTNTTEDRNNSRSFLAKKQEMPVVEKSDVYSKKETKKRKIKKNSVLPLGVAEKSEEKVAKPSKELNAGEPDKRKETADKKKRKNKKAKKNKKKKGKKEHVQEAVEPKVKKEQKQGIKATEDATTKDGGTEIKATEDATTKDGGTEIKATEDATTKGGGTEDKTIGRKLPCCFGFISTWLAKRKQKRRNKKRKAIENRATPPSLVQYEHKTAKGGEAFIIEIECRHLSKKPLLPPIKKTAGPIRCGSYYQLEAADRRRTEVLAKRKAAAMSYERKKAECKARKSEIDSQFRKKADLAIRCKQAGAERNRILSGRTTPRGSASTKSDPFDVSDSDTILYKSDEDDIDTFSDPDALKVDDVDIFSY